MDIRKQFGRNIRKLRLKKNWSQEQLADAAGLHRTYVSEIERGERNPTITVIEKFGLALEVRPEVLFKADEDQ